METILIIGSVIAIIVAVAYLFISFKKENEDYEDDFRDNNNFENTAEDFKPSYNENDDYGYGYEDESSFNFVNIFVWIVIGGILIFSFWQEYGDDDDYYYDDGYRRGYYGTTYYGSSRRYRSGHSSGGLRRSGSSFRGRSYGGGGK